MKKYRAHSRRNTEITGIPSRQEILSWILTEMLDQDAYARLSAPGGIFEHCKNKNDAHAWLARWRKGEGLSCSRIQKLEEAVFDVVLQADCALRAFKNDNDKQAFAESFWKKYRERATNRLGDLYPEKADVTELAVILFQFLQWNEGLSVYLMQHATMPSEQELTEELSLKPNARALPAEHLHELHSLVNQGARMPQSHEDNANSILRYKRIAEIINSSKIADAARRMEEGNALIEAVCSGKSVWRREYFEESGFVGESARFAWLTSFVLPYFAVRFAEMNHYFSGWDSGIPKAAHWYLPKTICHRNAHTEEFEISSFIMPCQQVLAWWESMFGRRLRGVSVPDSKETGEIENAVLIEKCYGTRGDAYALENARKKIDEWTSGRRAMPWAEIMQWTRDDLKWADSYQNKSISPPTNVEVRRYLMLAAAMQRVFSKYCGKCEENSMEDESAEGYGPVQAEFARAAFVELSNGAMAAFNELSRVIGPAEGRSLYIVKWIHHHFDVAPHYREFREAWLHGLIGAFDQERGPLWYLESMLATQRNAVSMH